LSDLPIVAALGDAVLLIEHRADGIFLHAFRVDGSMADTWHRSVDEAKAQAVYSWGDQVASRWRIAPAGIADAAQFARELLHNLRH
jgi:hypothetical protein